jgi:hypothetical protein
MVAVQYRGSESLPQIIPIATRIINALVGIFAPLSVKISCVVVLGSISNLNTGISTGTGTGTGTGTDFETNAADSEIGENHYF